MTSYTNSIVAINQLLIGISDLVVKLVVRFIADGIRSAITV